jgi:hypothetical protein
MRLPSLLIPHSFRAAFTVKLRSSLGMIHLPE